MTEVTVRVNRPLITHEVEIVDKKGERHQFRRTTAGAWEQFSIQRARWEPFGYPLVEALLDKVTEIA